MALHTPELTTMIEKELVETSEEEKEEFDEDISLEEALTSL